MTGKDAIEFIDLQGELRTLLQHQQLRKALAEQPDPYGQAHRTNLDRCLWVVDWARSPDIIRNTITEVKQLQATLK